MQTLTQPKVFVYFNLHKKMFSVRALNGPNKGRVIGHTSEICLKDAVFKVSEAGRQRVLREQRKNVHAGVVGTVASWTDAPHDDNGKSVTYNPYKFDSFVTVEDHAPIRGAAFAVLMHKRIKVWKCNS